MAKLGLSLMGAGVGVAGKKRRFWGRKENFGGLVKISGKKFGEDDDE